ncbi:hypothetical protein CS536_04395 [Yersinia kristensenii]|nr:hypothetical protein CS536_04395 [Yersinia kristensenii]
MISFVVLSIHTKGREFARRKAEAVELLPFLYPSSFKLQMCWLYSITRITYLCKLIGMLSFAAFL